jgi:hypothetical protein
VLGSGYALGLFLDIKGAFDNVIFEAFQKALEDRGTDPYLTRWIMYMITHRSVSAQLLGCLGLAAVCRGGAQGGVTTPLLWNLVIDDLLRDDPSDPVHKICYADDVTAITAGPSLNTLQELTQSFINKATVWANRCGLRLSEAKTVAVVFTSKRSREMKPLRLYGKDISVVNRVKCLGITLDQQLNWTPHVMEKTRKALSILAQLRRAYSATRVLTPKCLWWIYTAMIRPAIAYACFTWRSNLETQRCQKLLYRT